MARVLVTGGAGFFGSNIVPHLAKRGHDVTIIDRDPPRFGEARFIRHELQSMEGLVDYVKGHEIVIHLASTSDTRASLTDFRIDLDNSVVSTWNVLEAMRKSGTVKRCFFSSSQHVYGMHDGELQAEDAALRPISPYGASKVSCEAIFSAYSHTFGIQSVIGRFSNIIGRGQNYGVLPDFIKRLKSNPSELRIWGNGSQQRNFLHVSDLCSAIITLIEHGEERVNRVFNIANTHSLSVRRLAEIVVEQMGLGDCSIIPESQGSAGWSGDPGSLRPSVERLLSTGWKPQLDCEEAVRLAVNELV